MSSVAQADIVQALSMICFADSQAKEVPGAAVGNNWASEFDTQQEAENHEDVWKQFNGVSFACLTYWCCHCERTSAWQVVRSDSIFLLRFMIIGKAVVCLTGSHMHLQQFACIQGICRHSGQLHASRAFALI